jgi:hypothetical protein
MRGLSFVGWVVVGALGALTAITILSIGIFVAPFLVLAGVFVAPRTRYLLDVLGLVPGLSVSCLVVALATGDSHPCVEGSVGSCGGFDPHPWLLMGIVFIAGGLVLYAALRAANRIVPCPRAAK